MKRPLLLLFPLLLTFLQTQGQVTAGDRIISLQIDSTNGEPMTTAYEYVDSLCATAVHLSATWDVLEPSASTFDLSSLEKDLALAAGQNAQIELNLAPVNMGSVSTPPDLLNTRFDKPVMIDRFKTLLDSVFDRLGSQKLLALNIGNEYGGWLFDTTDVVSRIGHWLIFYTQARNYAKQQYAQSHGGDDLQVGTTFTYDYLTDPYTRDMIKYINDNGPTDVVSVNYYAIDNGFYFKPPSRVSDDFDTLTTVYADTSKPIYFTECGYPSGDTCGSSEALQSEFISEVFASWDEHRSAVKYISFFKSTDWSWWVADYLTQVISASAGWSQGETDRFRSYLATLGVRHFDGTKKTGYQTLVCEARARDFCNEYCSTATSIPSAGTAFSLEVYPTITEGITTLSMHTPTAGEWRITAVDMLGKAYPLLPAPMIGKGHHLRKLDLSALPEGHYFLKIRSNDRLLVKRVIKR